jgi:hypothetical protein
LTRLVELEFAGDAEKLAEMLEKATRRKFATVYNSGSNTYHIVRAERETLGGRAVWFRFGSPLTEQELKSLDEPAYQHYLWLRELRAGTRPPRQHYYVVKHGDVVMGIATPGRGRIPSRDKALAMLASSARSALWNHYYGGHRWEPVELLYYRREDEPPKTVISLKTPEHALKYVGAEEFEDYAAKTLRELRSL